MYRFVWAALIAIGCGKVQAKPDSGGPGNEAGGGACMTSADCSAPTPVCDPGTGCVECLQNDQCPTEKPTCDMAMHACRACAVDADCDSDVCDPQSGTCVTEANVLYASPTGSDTATCTKATPCSIVTAAALADQTRNNVKLAPGSYSIHLILTNKTLAFFGVGATIAGQGTNSVFEVDDGAHLRLVGMALTAGTGVSVLRCEGAATATHILELFRTTLDNTSTTVLANPCTVTIEQSVLRTTSTTDYQFAALGASVITINRSKFVGNNASGLIGLQNATYNISNSVFDGAGNPTDHGTFVGATFNVSFSTIVNGIVECSSSGATGLTLTSSIVFNPGGTVDTMQGIPACTAFNYSIAFPNAQPVGATNLSVDPGLKNLAADDYHLLVTSPALDHGDPASTNPIDFDGTPRPQGAGRDSGAFEFKP